MKPKDKKLPPLQDALLSVMRALDNQIAREMQRNPAELEAHGVQKWEPYQRRIELLCGFILDSVGENTVSLDPLIVLSQTFAKTLKMLVDELEQEGLGKIRAEYCINALSLIRRDCDEGLAVLRGQQTLV